MSEVVTALATMGCVVVVGALWGRAGGVGTAAQGAIATVTFTVAIPALLVATLAPAELGVLLSAPALVMASASVLVAALSWAAFRLVLRRSAAESAIAMFTASYTNAVVLGLPLSVYLLGSPLPVVPLVLVQLVVIAPATVLLLQASGADATTARTARDRAAMLANPILLATLVGVVLGSLPWSVPSAALQPFEMMGAAAAPLALLLLGMSLAQATDSITPGRRRLLGDLTVVVLTRAAVHPLLAWLLARAVGLNEEQTLAVVVLAALPTAQNAVVYARRYGAGVALAGSATVVSTVLTLPVLLVLTSVLS